MNTTYSKTAETGTVAPSGDASSRKFTGSKKGKLVKPTQLGEHATGTLHVSVANTPKAASKTETTLTTLKTTKKKPTTTTRTKKTRTGR